MTINIKSFIFFAAMILLISGCKQQQQDKALFTLLTPEETGILFSNTIFETDSFNVMTFGYIYNGGGVAVGDINNDGLKDLYFAGNMVPGELYLNMGNLKFKDITIEAGVHTDSWATGVTMVDVNQDGLQDIYVCTINPDVTEVQTPNLLFINKGVGADGIPVFEEEANGYGLDDRGYSTQAAFFDYDKDNDLDMYLLTNHYDKTSRNIPGYKLTKGSAINTDRLYRNNGNQTFTNVSKEAGIQIEGWGLGVAISDINQDGWPDIYVANDFISNDLLWMNNQDGTFTNQISKFLKHQSYSSMGTDIADYNNDGLPDIIVVDMMPEDNKRQKTTMSAPDYNRFQLNKRMGYETQYMRNTLQLNNGDNTFSEVGQLAGVHATDWSWSPLFADFDNDGWRDLFVTNGFVKEITDLDYVRYNSEIVQFGSPEEIRQKLKKEFEKIAKVKIPNYLYKNNGDLTFADKSVAWGLAEPSNSSGAAYADLDNDGDLDLIINNLSNEAFIYRNNTQRLSENNFLRIELNGQAPNLDGIGTTIQIKSKGEKQFYEHYLTRGYKSSVDNIIHFGFGKTGNIDSLEVTWPDGSYQLLTDVKSNILLTLNYENATIQKPDIKPAVAPLMREAAADFGIGYVHEERDYVDFNKQPLIPHKYSQNGPGIAVGDVNGDGREDFFVGGSNGHSGVIFLQNKEGKFKGKPLSNNTNKEDDMGALFFDADEDGDLDLYVVTGGNEFKSDSENYQHRLFKNDGYANFELDEQDLPTVVSSGSCVIASDFDVDGDLDLFVGGRNKPQQYPLPGTSYILRNDQGTFVDVTHSVCPELENLGMVTSALWTDFNNDKLVDLIVVGEWMPISFFKNENGILRNTTSTTGLKNSSGWWNSLSAGDFDNDGDTDYVAGNLGLNSTFKASVKEPVSVFAKDFDDNGIIDPILGHFILGKQYPSATRDALMGQMPSMRKKFKSYSDYGKVTLDQMFSDEQLKDAYSAHSYTFESSYIENLGNGKFSRRALPMRAQFAPIFGILPYDYNKDGNLDLLSVGNSFATETSMGYYDASYGEVFEGNGQGDFKSLKPKETGFFINGDAKAIAQLVTSSNNFLTIVSVNSDALRIFETQEKTNNMVIEVQPTDAYAEIYFKNGKKRREEFYYGSSYLSQSSRMLLIEEDELEEVYITDYKGSRREVRVQAIRSVVLK